MKNTIGKSNEYTDVPCIKTQNVNFQFLYSPSIDKMSSKKKKSVTQASKYNDATFPSYHLPCKNKAFKEGNL